MELFHRLRIGITFILIVCGFSAKAQTVDSLVHNGEKYYVYPFRQSVKIHDDYWKIIDDEAFFADYNNYFNHFSGDFEFSREAFQVASGEYLEELQKQLKKRWKWILRGRGFGKSVMRTLRERPGELIEVEYSHEKDVLPPFEKIPDGKYVQLFEEICIVDQDGKRIPDAYQIAGYFTIKNNVIDGEAVWMDFKGDTLKQGNFEDGLKVGEWKIRYPSGLSYSVYRLDRKRLRKGGSIYRSYATDYTNFQNGLLHGPYRYNSYGNYQQVVGAFSQGEATGEWRYSTGSRLTLRVQMANSTDTVISKKPLLRGTTMVRPREYYWYEDGEQKEYDLSCRLAPMPEFPSNFYEIQFGKPNELELQGENEKSYDLTDARRYGEYGDYDMSPYKTGYSYGTNVFELDPTTGKSFPRWHLLDSLGARMRFDGVYEQFYMNGQLFFRYEFENGELKSEDTLFWDNGKPMDVIVFEPDSNKYYRSLYARDGVLYDVAIYDSIGRFIEYLEEDQPKPKELLIDGILAKEYTFENRLENLFEPATFYYNARDTLENEDLNSKVILQRTWAEDTTIQINEEYDASTHEYVYEQYNCFGEVYSRTTRTFTDDYSGWTGTKVSSYLDLTLKQTQSGIRYDLDEEVIDTMKHRNVWYANYYYDVSKDRLLLRNGEPFTGKYTRKPRRGLPKIKSKSDEIAFLYSKGYRGYRKFYRAQRKHKKGKRFMMKSFTNGTNYDGANNQLWWDFEGYYEQLLFDYDRYLSFVTDYVEFGIKSIEGNFLDGKAHGVWTAYDFKGKVVSTLNFNHGEADGELRLYNYQDKRRKHGYYYYFDDAPELDTFPDRRTRYLQQVIHFKNGVREGEAVEYDWLGREVISCNYVNDEIDGKMVSWSPDVHTEATFKEGYLDGYLKTYLTFPKRDSILLYDINLQNGMLNGESRSYHTNGKLAKRGFFLDDEPIEDYEAYDTLGFKFHYVKFQYGMPVEEKIWEENALSIRYQFNWKDSIEFYPDDITSTMSLEALLAKEGYTSYSIQDKYYGRTALISKDEIECQMTKYYPNDTVARDGKLLNKQKVGLWKFYSYNGQFLYEANYFDSIIVINDSVRFKSKGILTDYDDAGNRLYSAYIIEKFEKYDCAHTDHYEIRQLITIDEEHDSLGRMNGFVQNFYDNGTLQSEGTMKNGIPDGLWKFYDPFGKLNKMGNYTLGKRNGRWLEGDLEKKKYLGEICMNPNLPDLEEQKEYQENLLDITIINYVMGKLKSTQYYDLNMNRLLEMEESRSN